jgi:hypothetical protein
MNENRIKLRVEPEMTPVRMDDKLDLNAEIKVKVDSHLTGLGIFGLVMIAVATVLLLAGSILFSVAFPEKWYAQTVSYDTSRTIIRAVVLMLGAGVVSLFLGTASYFYGRTVLGCRHPEEDRPEACPRQAREARPTCTYHVHAHDDADDDVQPVVVDGPDARIRHVDVVGTQGRFRGRGPGLPRHLR